MKIELNLADFTKREAHAVLLALATCYAEGSGTTTSFPKKEKTGDKLLKAQDQRVAEREGTTAVDTAPPAATVRLPLMDAALASKLAPDTAPPMTAGPPTTPQEQPAGASSTVTAGPPINQPLDENDPSPATQPPPVAVQHSQIITDGKIDASGMPWDERIHAGTMTFMKSSKRKGCWKYKPKTDAALIAQVESELRAALPPAQQIDPNINVGAPPLTSSPAATPEGTVPIGEVVQHTFNSAGDFPALLRMVTYDVGQKKVPQSASSSISVDLGFQNIMVLGTDPTQYQAFVDCWVALRGMIALDPSIAEQATNDWLSVRNMLALAV